MGTSAIIEIPEELLDPGNRRTADRSPTL